MMTEEKVISAARGTVELLKKFAPSLQPTRLPADELTVSAWKLGEHVLWCALQIEEMIKAGRREKAMRWLGYIQGVTHALGAATIEELKNLNRPDDGSSD